MFEWGIVEGPIPGLSHMVEVACRGEGWRDSGNGLPLLSGPGQACRTWVDLGWDSQLLALLTTRPSVLAPKRAHSPITTAGISPPGPVNSRKRQILWGNFVFGGMIAE